MLENWQKYRQNIIAATLIGSVLTVGYMFLNAEVGKRQVANFDFPENIELPKWKLIKSNKLTKDISENTKTYEAVLTANHYQYQNQENNQILDIKVHYVLGTLGDSYSYYNKYINPPTESEKNINDKTKQSKIELKEKPDIGFYSIISNQDNYNLVACINPRGGSTVKVEQFLANRKTYDFTNQRILGWLLGQNSLRDRRCLFTALSLAKTNNISPEKTLEEAWFNWYQWWSQNFPRQ